MRTPAFWLLTSSHVLAYAREQTQELRIPQSDIPADIDSIVRAQLERLYSFAGLEVPPEVVLGNVGLAGQHP